MNRIFRISVVIVFCGAALVWLSQSRVREAHAGPFTVEELQEDYKQSWGVIKTLYR